MRIKESRMKRRVVIRIVLLLIALGVINYAQTARAPQTRNANANSNAGHPVVGRSIVETQFGIVAASHPLAARAGVEMLERGGNAVDAAIAANATIGLMEPAMNGMGGDLFVVYYEAKTGKTYGLNASGWAPTGLSAEYMKAKGYKAMPQGGIYIVTVPGAVAGWDELRSRFGAK